uniref:fosfomycin resistance glutathione transferase n=1 Tax=Thaumasiovibrio occultus TaxID=1891184 RepID=UPI000B359662|nr:fosfomycin resistance glutathione transferase [Thaumasiovibrio occultus]
MITGLNHITLAVSDVERSLAFYTQRLGFTGHVKWDKGAYLSVGDLWLCLSLDTPCPKDDYTHLAFSVAPDAFVALVASLTDPSNCPVTVWKQNKSEGQSLYLLDPDGHKLEIHVGCLQSRLHALKTAPYQGLVWL